MSEPVVLTEEQLRERCAYWQKVLRLEDWDINLRIAAVDGQGEEEANLSKRYAFIRICDPKYYGDERVVPQDMERTLVHELLHLHLEPCGVPTSGPKNEALEVAVHRLSEALVVLHRASQPLS